MCRCTRKMSIWWCISFVCFTFFGAIEGKCPSQSEMVILIDESISIGYYNYQKMKRFVANFAEAFEIGHNRFSVTTFDHGAHMRFDLSEYGNIYSLKQAIYGLSYGNGGTNIAAALANARTNSFRNARPNVPKIILLITDGYSSGRELKEANILKRETGAIIFCIGVGSWVNKDLLKKISSDNSYTTIVNSFDLLLDITDRTASSTCSQNIDECISNPCQHGGRCEDKVGHYICHCAKGYHGLNCESGMCPTRCEYLPWSIWSSCSVTCGTTSYKSRSRSLCCSTDILDREGTDGCLRDCNIPNGGLFEQYEDCGRVCFNGGNMYDWSAKCDCVSGFSGSCCETEDQCVTRQPCQHGGICKTLDDSYECICPSNWQGTNCEIDVNECAGSTDLCKNGGTCHNTPGSFYCTCTPGWEGTYCTKDINECQTGTPCKNNGTCTNTVGSYTCFCPSTWTGRTCDVDVNECAGTYPVCFNGGTCYNHPGSFLCTCDHGWTGSTCNKDIDECSSSPCANCGYCVNLAGHYTCKCSEGFSGDRCCNDVDECLKNITQCENEGKCQNSFGGSTCECTKYHHGQFCEQVYDICESSPCMNNGTCSMYSDDIVCTCNENFTGKFCEKEIDLCDSRPCLNNGTCTFVNNTVICKCSDGYQGDYCEEDIDECLEDPCPENATCTNVIGGFTCNCTSLYNDTFDECLMAKENSSCDPHMCLNGGHCNNIGNNSCECAAGWTGAYCDTDINECENNTCPANATCTNIDGSFDCDCGTGLVGHTCSEDIDECTSSPCYNSGLCLNTYGGFLCLCQGGYTGQRCKEDIDECQSSPCHNDSTCTNSHGSFSCCCPQGRKGTLCDEDVDECQLMPCKNNGTCRNTDGGYVCDCKSDFTSKNCEEDVDECTSSPCKNGGVCDNHYGGMKCRCMDGWGGTYCDGDVDECREIPGGPCKNGGSCENTNGSYLCHCPHGINWNWTGQNCTQDVEECRRLPSPCQNGGSCLNFPGSYNCTCQSGFTGRNCENDINECTVQPCFNNGICENTHGSFNCHCVDDWDGPLCTIDLCKTQPAELVFLVDASRSTSSTWFKKQLDFVTGTVAKLTVADDRFNISVITYATEANLAISFGAYDNKSDLLDRIGNVSFKDGITDIKKACGLAKKILPTRKGSAQYVFLLTDGMPTNLSAAVEGVTELRNHLLNSHIKNRLYVISAGYDVRPEGLAALSDDRFYFKDLHTTCNDDALFDSFRFLVDRKCSACSSTPTDETDIVFLIDTGAQQSFPTFILQTHVLDRFIHRLKILTLGENNTQIAAVMYSSDIKDKIWLNSTYDAVAFSSFLSGVTIDTSNSTSDVGNALNFVRNEILSPPHGARPSSRKIVIIPVTGFDQNENKTLEEINSLKKDDVIILAVGIGGHFKDEIVLKMASDALFAAFAEEGITDEYVRMILRHVNYFTCTSRINA